MIAEVATVMKDEALLSDELRIIAGEDRLSSKDRDSLRKSAELLDGMLEAYGRVYFRLTEAEGKLKATEDRLREANAALSGRGAGYADWAL